MLFQILDTESQRSLTFPCWQSISLLPFQPRHFQCGSCRLPFGAMAEVKMTFLLHRTSPLPCCFDGSWIDPVRTGWVRLSRVLPKRMAEGHLLISGYIVCFSNGLEFCGCLQRHWMRTTPKRAPIFGRNVWFPRYGWAQNEFCYGETQWNVRTLENYFKIHILGIKRKTIDEMMRKNITQNFFRHWIWLCATI